MAFGELFRVLKPAGRLVIFTATPEQMKNYWLNHYFPAMLEGSITKMPSLNSIEQAATKAWFMITALEKYYVQRDLQDHFLYSGKHDPEIYFNESIRRNISSFAALANQIEVEKGLKQLRKDIDTKQFENIRDQFSNDPGDYLFMLLER